MRTRRRGGEHGQVMIIFAFALIVLLGMIGIAIDGGYALVQARRAQNAADFASIAGTAQLKALCEQGAARRPTRRPLVMQDVIDQNAPVVGRPGPPTTSTRPALDRGIVVSTSPSTFPPPYACGVKIKLDNTWLPYIAQVLGFDSLTTTASAKALNGVQPGKNVGIIALDKAGPHSILGNGQGSFNIHGDIFANSSVPNNPWTSTQAGGFSYTDVIDAKDNSNLSVYGNLISVTGMPFDWCFGTKTVPANINKPAGWNETTQGPWNAASLLGGQRQAQPTSTTSSTRRRSTTRWGQRSPTRSPHQRRALPRADDRADVHQAPRRRPAPARRLQLPGDRSPPPPSSPTAAAPSTRRRAGYPGVYRFPEGLYINTAAGATVQGYNILIATGSPFPMAGNVPGNVSKGVFTASGAGNGAPCFPSGSADVSSASPACAGTGGEAPRRDLAQPEAFKNDGVYWGTGTNFSLIIGGKGTVTLGAPAYGMYNGMSLFQSRGTSGNFGFDAEAGDSAAITIAGTVYNNSESNYGSGLPQEYWDVGTVYYPGGDVQTGMGTGTNQTASSGSVTIQGTCIVDDFVTDGDSTITVDGAPYTLPGLELAERHPDRLMGIPHRRGRGAPVARAWWSSRSSARSRFSSSSGSSAVPGSSSRTRR